MGGSNSGRYGGKIKCEHCLSIDVRMLARKGSLKSGAHFSLKWSNGSSIGGFAEAGRLVLQYSTNGGASCTYPVHLIYTDCNYGGRRAWFSCPCCGGRNAMLFLRGSRFACRTCQRLRYHSQALDTMARNQWAYHRVQNKLDDGDGKPKGMHWRTFEKLHDRLERIDQKINLAFNLSAMRFFKRFGRL